MEYLCISKYSPDIDYRTASAWTSVSEIGKEFDDGVLTFEEYRRVEDMYVAAFDLVLRLADTDQVLVSDISPSSVASADAASVRDGQIVSRARALEIGRMFMRDELGCRLEVPGQVYVASGYDYYAFVGGERVDESTIDSLEALGLWVKRDFIYRDEDDPAQQ